MSAGSEAASLSTNGITIYIGAIFLLSTEHTCQDRCLQPSRSAAGYSIIVDLLITLYPARNRSLRNAVMIVLMCLQGGVAKGGWRLKGQVYLLNICQQNSRSEQKNTVQKRNRNEFLARCE